MCDHPVQLNAAALELTVVHSVSKEALTVKAFFSTSGRMMSGGAARLLEFQKEVELCSGQRLEVGKSSARCLT
ncbi:hypothetical protein Ancab_008743, partial [Ancistrocladus abbreviatus]